LGIHKFRSFLTFFATAHGVPRICYYYNKDSQQKQVRLCRATAQKTRCFFVQLAKTLADAPHLSLPPPQKSELFCIFL
jgi:hypothetical protein